MTSFGICSGTLSITYQPTDGISKPRCKEESSFKRIAQVGDEKYSGLREERTKSRSAVTFGP
jgi:hypothetical protein